MFGILNAWWAWYRNSGFDQATLAVPLVETTVLLIALTICLLFRFARTGLILAFMFLYRWGWTVHIGNFTSDPALQTAFAVGYLIFGIMIFTFTVVGMLFRGGSHDA